MPLPNVTFNIQVGQLGRLGDTRKSGGLVMGGVPTSSVNLGETYVIYSVKAAENLGLDSTYDITNKVLVHYHISEFFRLNPSGELYFMLVPQGTSMTDMVNKDLAFGAKLLRDGEGKVWVLGIILNPLDTYTPSLAGGFDEDVLLAIPKAQELADSEFQAKRFIPSIFIEGREINGLVGDMDDLHSLVGGPYRNVTVVGLQDIAIAALEVVFSKHAAVGTAVGISTIKELHESYAWAKSDFNITDAAQGRFLEVGLSSNISLADITEADQSAYHDKGLVFGRVFPRVDGVYFSQSLVCAPIDDDFNASELVEVIYEAVYQTYLVLVPWINATVDVDTSTGRIEIKTRKIIEAEIRTKITTSMSNNISSLELVIVDPEKDENNVPYPTFLLDSTLRVIIGIVPKGKAKQIIVNIGFTQ